LKKSLEPTTTDLLKLKTKNEAPNFNGNTPLKEEGEL